MPIDLLSLKQCLAQPTAIGLGREYARFGAPGTDGRYPCRRSRDPGISGPKVRNQCAVRMSVALCRSMNHDVFGAYGGGALHSNRCCAGAEAEKHRHITSAETLFNYLKDTLGFTFTQVGNNPTGIPRSGIIFFRNIQGFRAGVGDHIDYWNGTTYFNEVTGSGAPTGNLDLFRRATNVWFCAL